jgi:hypothetical protein
LAPPASQIAINAERAIEANPQLKLPENSLDKAMMQLKFVQSIRPARRNLWVLRSVAKKTA